MEMQSLTVLKENSLKGRCQQDGAVPPWRLGGILPGLFQLLVAVGISWPPYFMATSLQSLPALPHHCALCVSVLLGRSLVKIFVIGFSVHQDDLISILLT